MSVLAVIPARGGSKRLKGKNLRLCAGKPLLQWSVEEALRSKLVTRVVVSSDSDEILAAAERMGATPLHRPARLATDRATTDRVLVHAVMAERAAGSDYDLVVLLQPTSPYRPSVDGWTLTDACVRRLRAVGAASLFTATPLHFVWKEGPLGLFEQENAQNRPRSQDFGSVDRRYHENGAVFVIRTEALLSTVSRLVPPIAILECPFSPDIDTENDLKLAGKLLPEG